MQSKRCFPASGAYVYGWGARQARVATLQTTGQATGGVRCSAAEEERVGPVGLGLRAGERAAGAVAVAVVGVVGAPGLRVGVPQHEQTAGQAVSAHLPAFLSPEAAAVQSAAQRATQALVALLLLVHGPGWNHAAE